MIDAHSAIVRKTHRPLATSLSGLREQLDEAKQEIARAEPGSFHSQQWSQRADDIERTIEDAHRLPVFGRTSLDLPFPIVDEAYVRRLISQGESELLDFKTDLPPRCGQDPSSRSDLLKDILAVANTVTGGLGHLVYGREETGSLRAITQFLDDADVQQWVENAIEPMVSFCYQNVGVSGVDLAVIVVRPARERPHVAKATVSRKGSLHAGQVWFRRGSKNTVATYSDLHRLFRDEAVGPLHFERLSDSGCVLLQDWFQSLRREVFVGRATQRDQLVGSGYEVAIHPLNSQVILIGPDGQLFLRPVPQEAG